MTSLTRLSLLALLCALQACDGDGVSRDESVGALDNGTFQYLCVDDSDPLCPTGRFATDFPGRIGTDGVFDLDYDPDEGSAAGITITPVAADIIAIRSTSFRAAASGTTAMIAQRGSTGRVVDILHLDVVDVAALQIEQQGSVPRLTLEPGATRSYDAVAVDEEGLLLAGAREYTWTVSDPGVLRLDQESPTAHMDVRAIAEGRATLTVTSGDASDSLQILVERGATIPEAGPAPDGDGGSVVGLDASVDAATPMPDGGARPDAGDGGAKSADAGADGGDGGVDAAADAGDAGDAAP